jgi:hypothetical protein
MVNGIAALSLLLATLFVMLWVSRILPRQFWIAAPAIQITVSHHHLVTHGGENVFFVDDLRLSDRRIIGPFYSSKADVTSFKNQFGQPVFHINWLRFKSLTEPIYFTEGNGRISMGGTRLSLGIPYGYVLILFLLLPTWRWLPPGIQRIQQRFIIKPGICRRCGYDLRATPDRCPECGTVLISS